MFFKSLKLISKKLKKPLASHLALVTYPFLIRTRKQINFKMKKLIFVFVTGFFLVACSKKEISSPEAATQNVFFKNANVEVENLQVNQLSGNEVSVNFSTAYENNIQRIELMSSASVNTFCSIDGVDTQSNSQSLKNYSFQDNNIKGNVMYYMLRFEDNYGNWTYSNYYTVKIN